MTQTVEEFYTLQDVDYGCWKRLIRETFTNSILCNVRNDNSIQCRR